MVPTLIAITGGIGAGKSVVCRILRLMGHPVYDCDANAKRLMDDSADIKARLLTDIHPLSVDGNGAINREVIANTVFADADKLAALNAIVHGAVRADIRRWQHTLDAPVAFVETAILRESGLAEMVAGEWHVTAPDELRIQRVMARNGLSHSQVSQRLASQNAQPALPGALLIYNTPTQALLPQIWHALAMAEGEHSHG